MRALNLPKALDLLEGFYGRQKPPKVKGAWEMVLWENVAYLADDERRQQAFEVLKKRIGTEPKLILAASEEALLEVTRHGILPDQFAEKLRTCARGVLRDFAGDLRPVLTGPVASARKALQRFPGIGAPGADKILLFIGASTEPTVESNGIRVLERLGFNQETKNYAASYRAAQRALVSGTGSRGPALIRAYLLLRRHGKALCRRSKPPCPECPLNAGCAFYLKTPEATKAKS